MKCPHCGVGYRDFRTGLTYQEVYTMLWSSSEDSSNWRYKRRNTVLGLWHQIKVEMWEEHLHLCEKNNEVPF